MTASDHPEPATTDASERVPPTDPALYGDSFADVYDDWYGDVSDVQATVETVATLAAGGPVLELGVGTGRLAIPLAARGVPVTGVDASQGMLDRLSANDDAGRVRPVLGDMSDLVFTGEFDAAFVAYNTLFNLTSDAAQRRCFRTVAAALRPAGCFAVEVFVPEMTGDDDRDVTPRLLPDGGVVLTATMRRSAHQVVHGQHIELRPDGTVRLRPWRIRYTSPEQLDAMASEAGFVVESRWADWAGAPFHERSSRHVTIYRLGPITDGP